MKTFSMSVGVLFMASVLTHAQEPPPTPRLEVGLNYSLLHANLNADASQITSNGGSGYFAYNVSRVLGLVADFGGYGNGSVHGPLDSDSTFTYLFGPRFNWRHWSRVTPYVQALFGGARISATTNLNGTMASSDQNGFATAAGGGVDIAITHHIAIKPIQIEYVMSQVPSFATNRNSYQNSLRYSAGVALRFGEK
jgi:opacity protein-like surface antigen